MPLTNTSANAVVIAYASIAALRAVPPPAVSNLWVSVLGRTGPGDGTALTAYWDPNNTTADTGTSNTTAVNPTGHTGNGRWVFAPVPTDQVTFTPNAVGAEALSLLTLLSLTMFPQTFVQVGDNGAGELAVQRAITAAQLVQVPVNFNGQYYTFKTAGVTVNLVKTKLVGHGATIDCTALASGTAAFTLSGDATSDINYMGGQITAHPMEGFFLFGPDSTGGANTCGGIVLSPITENSLPWANNFVIREVGIRGFYKQVAMGEGAFNVKFDSVVFCSSNARGGSYGIYITGTGANNGERYSVTNCTFDNLLLVDIYVATVCDLYVECTSFDGAAAAFDHSTVVHLHTTNCHFEGFTGDTAPMIHLRAFDNARWIDHGSEFIHNGNRANPYVQIDAGNQGAVVDGTLFQLGTAASYPGDTIIAGSGIVKHANVQLYATDYRLPLSQYTNCFRDGNFTAASALNDWLPVTGTGSIAIDSTTAGPNGGQSLKMINSTPNTSGQTTLTSRTFPCKAGQIPAMRFYLKTSGLVSASGALIYTVNFLDTDGQVIATNGVAFTTESAAFEAIPITLTASNAPQGTVGVQWVLGINAANSAYDIWIANLNACVM